MIKEIIKLVGALHWLLKVYLISIYVGISFFLVVIVLARENSKAFHVFSHGIGDGV